MLMLLRKFIQFVHRNITFVMGSLLVSMSCAASPSLLQRVCRVTEDGKINERQTRYEMKGRYEGAVVETRHAVVLVSNACVIGHNLVLASSDGQPGVPGRISTEASPPHHSRIHRLPASAAIGEHLAPSLLRTARYTNGFSKCPSSPPDQSCACRPAYSTAHGGVTKEKSNTRVRP